MVEVFSTVHFLIYAFIIEHFQFLKQNYLHSPQLLHFLVNILHYILHLLVETFFVLNAFLDIKVQLLYWQEPLVTIAFLGKHSLHVHPLQLHQ